MPVDDQDYLEEELRASRKIGAIIRKTRVHRQMSPGQLATKLDMSPQAVWLYENGLVSLMASRVAEIAYALDVPVGVLFGQTPPRDGDRIDPRLLDDTRTLRSAWENLPSKTLKKSALEFVRSIADEQNADV